MRLFTRKIGIPILLGASVLLTACSDDGPDPAEPQPKDRTDTLGGARVDDVGESSDHNILPVLVTFEDGVVLHCALDASAEDRSLNCIDTEVPPR